LNESDELIRIFMASIKTALQNARVQKRRTRATVTYPSGETD